MTDTPDNPLSTDTAWKDSLAGDNEDYAAALEGFNSPDDLFGSLSQAQNYDWRSEAAGDDDKFKSQLERFDSIGSFANSFREAQQTISSGQLKDPLPDNASDDQVRAYREANGIPLESSGYLENLPDGLVLGEEDKEVFASFAETLHNINADPTVAHAALSWYNDFAEMQQDALAEADHTNHIETEDTLRQEWGGDYRQNINMVGAMIEKTFGQDGKEILLNSRGPDGRALMNNTEILYGLAEMARGMMHPMAIPGQTNDPQQTVDDEIAEIEKLMREDRQAYNKDEAKQARLRQLYDIRSKHQAA
jgi:hypothetical protein